MTLQDFSLKPNRQADTSSYDLEDLKQLITTLDDEDALRLYGLLAARVNLGAAKIDLLAELDMQFRNAKMLQAEASDNRSESGMKDRTQTLSSVTNLIKTIAEVRETVLSQERLKRYEAALRKVLKGAPAEMREMYVDLYGEFLTSEVIEELR